MRKNISLFATAFVLTSSLVMSSQENTIAPQDINITEKDTVLHLEEQLEAIKSKDCSLESLAEEQQRMTRAIERQVEELASITRKLEKRIDAQDKKSAYN